MATIINDEDLYNDYIETVAERLGTLPKVVARFIQIDDLEDVINDMYQAETDHIASNLMRYQEALNNS